MANVVRTRDQLYALWPDNTTRLISAQDGRDFIASAFGFVVAGSPGSLNDLADTQGVGAKFDAGSRWIDSTGLGRLWFCIRGPVSAAIWQAMMYDGQAAGGKLTGTYPNPGVNLAASDIPNLDASKITSGVFNAARIPDLDASKIISGTFNYLRLPIMQASGPGHAPGAAPDPPAIAGTAKFLREDATWVDPVGSMLGISGMPVGSILPYGNVAPPSGWLLCDGSAVSRTTYADLFAVIGTTFGVGDGLTTFNLPDLTRRYPLGPGGSNVSGQVGTTLGSSGGEEMHTLTIAEMPAHSHDYDKTNLQNVLSPGIDTVSSESYTATSTTSAGGGSAHNNLPPTLVLQWIVRHAPSISINEIPDLPASKVTSGQFDTARVPDLDAGKITSGQFGTGRIPDLDAAKITSGQFGTARIPDLDASKITTGTFGPAFMSIMVASGPGHAPGAVPDPPASAGTTKFLREDATWAVPAGGGSAVTEGGHQTGTSVDAYVTLFDVVGSFGLDGSFGFRVVSGNNLRYRITAIDAWGNSGNLPVGISTFSGIQQYRVDELNATIGGSLRLPIVHVTLEVQSQTAGAPGDYETWYVVIGK